MHQAIRQFGNELKQGGVGLFYYAGHGMQVQGKNYLIPVGTAIELEDEVQSEAIEAGLIQQFSVNILMTNYLQKLVY